MSNDKEQLSRILASMKGLAGSGNVLSYLVDKIDGLVATMEPGDFVRSDTNTASSVPVAADLWYLFYHDNLMEKYQQDNTVEDVPKYKSCLTTYLSFLKLLKPYDTSDAEGYLKPLKIITDLAQLEIKEGFGEIIPTEYKKNGVYWINTIAFELWTKDKGYQYASDGPKDFKPNDYVGYISFPIGQLGVMEVISLLQETELSGYKFTAVDNSGFYWTKAAPTLEDKDKPKTQSTPEMFPDGKDENGNILAGQNYCFGRHLIESAYLVPETATQNLLTKESESPVNRDVELFSSKMEKYAEEVEPKLWMRYWIHKDSKLPVPGEFIGILCRPVAAPPHVWWFQESSPFLYAGNWLETGNLTSGIVTKVTLETDREDGGTGNEYDVKIQGCEVTVYSTDFYDYKVGDRVAILKLDSTATPSTDEQKAAAKKSFTWLDQVHLKASDGNTVKSNLVIIPATFYKKR